MRRLFGSALFSSVLLLFGLLMLVGGGTAAILTGPDDTVALVSQEVAGAEGVPLVTAPGITAFTDVDLVVTASASGGVFVGSAHRVDVRNLVAGVEHFEVTQALPTIVGGIAGTAWDGGEFMRGSNLDVAELDVWHHQATGDGEQRIVLPLDGDPVGVLVVPADSSTPVVGFAVRIAGLFTGSLLVGTAGAGLLLARWLLRRRQTPSSGAPAEGQSIGEQPAEKDLPPADTTRPHAPALRTVAALTIGAVALSGCAIPSTVTQEEPQKVALPADSLADLVAAHDERRVRAVKAARFPKSDPSRWQGAFAGPMLEAARYASSSDQAYKKRSRRPDPTTAGGQVWSPTFGSYPMWPSPRWTGSSVPARHTGTPARIETPRRPRPRRKRRRRRRRA